MERPHRPRSSRTGFTLVEILVVILIIATLLALLLPAIKGAIRAAREAQVSAELNSMATALASFKTTYNDYPPSRVLLCEQGYTQFLSSAAAATMIPSDGGSATDITYGQLAQRSLTIMRRFWPRADFLSNPGTLALPGHFNDFNGNGKVDANNIILNGSECLAFFLGGIPTNDGGTPLLITGVSGFSKSPTMPFVPNLVINGASIAPNRTVPNYEFNNGRLIDQDGDHIPSYIDPLDTSPGNRRAYAYFSSYGNNTYDPNDVNGYGHTFDPNYELEEDDTTFVERGFQVAFPPGSVISPGPNPYTSGNPSGNTPSWINPNSFQIISAGQDRQFGLGGTFNQTSTSGTGKLPILPAASDAGNIHNDDTTNVRLRESDNLTNFSAGRLD